MADISKISPDAGTTEYNVKDATARSDIASIVEKIPVNASSSNKFATEADIASAYHAAGTKTVAELLSSLLVAANEGNVYNMTDAGTTTADFIEGAGKPIRIGDNVGVCKVGNDYKFDLLSGFIDTSNFVEKSSTSGLLKNDGTVDTTSYVEAETGKGLSTNDYDATAKGIVDSIPLTVSQLQGSLLEKFPRSEQTVLGAKNRLPFPYKHTTKTENGVTFTVNSNGSITINGTATADTLFKLLDKASSDNAIKSLLGQTFIFNGIVNGDANFFANINVWGSSPITDMGNGVIISIPSNATGINAYIQVMNGKTVNNVTVYPMLRLATDTDSTYVPYAMTNKELTETISTEDVAYTAGTGITLATDENKTRCVRSGNIVSLSVAFKNTEAQIGAFTTVISTVANEISFNAALNVTFMGVRMDNNSAVPLYAGYSTTNKQLYIQSRANIPANVEVRGNVVIVL